MQPLQDEKYDGTLLSETSPFVLQKLMDLGAPWCSSAGTIDHLCMQGGTTSISSMKSLPWTFRKLDGICSACGSIGLRVSVLAKKAEKDNRLGPR